MPNLTTLSSELDEKAFTCRAIIETPTGSRNKFSYDPETGPFKLGGLLPEGMQFPCDFGFVPSTLTDDDDPVDSQPDVIVNFGTAGLWEYKNNTSWVQLSSLSPGVIAVGHINAP